MALPAGMGEIDESEQQIHQCFKMLLPQVLMMRRKRVTFKDHLGKRIPKSRSEKTLTNWESDG